MKPMTTTKEQSKAGLTALTAMADGQGGGYQEWAARMDALTEEVRALRASGRAKKLCLTWRDSRPLGAVTLETGHVGRVTDGETVFVGPDAARMASTIREQWALGAAGAARGWVRRRALESQGGGL